MRTKLLLLAALTAMFASCQNENEVAQTNVNFPEDGVIRIHAGVDDLRTRGFYSTIDLDGFGICIGNGASETYCYDNIKVTGSNGTVWTPAETMLWQDAEQPVDIVAYAPHQANMAYTATTTDVVANVSAEQTEADKSSDFLICKKGHFVPGNGLVDGKVEIAFAHAMSQLVVEIKLATEFNQPGIPDVNPITDMKVRGTVIEGTCDFSAPSPVVVRKEDMLPTAVTPYETKFTPAKSQAEYCFVTYKCILVPQTVAAGKFSITFVIDDKAYEWKSTKEETLQEGISYTLELTVGKDVVRRGSMTSTPWTEEAKGNIATE